MDAVTAPAKQWYVNYISSAKVLCFTLANGMKDTHRWSPINRTGGLSGIVRGLTTEKYSRLLLATKRYATAV